MSAPGRTVGPCESGPGRWSAGLSQGLPGATPPARFRPGSRERRARPRRRGGFLGSRKAQSPHGQAERQPEQDQRDDPKLVRPSGAYHDRGDGRVDGHHAERAAIECRRARCLHLQLALGKRAQAVGERGFDRLRGHVENATHRPRPNARTDTLPSPETPVLPPLASQSWPTIALGPPAARRFPLPRMPVLTVLTSPRRGAMLLLGK